MNKINGCIYCRHYESKIIPVQQFTVDGFFIATNERLVDVRKCNIGLNHTCAEWWARNGRRKDDFEVLPCFENTDFSDKMDDFIKRADEILEKLKCK